jgi:hypothetical protein
MSGNGIVIYSRNLKGSGRKKIAELKLNNNLYAFGLWAKHPLEDDQ